MKKSIFIICLITAFFFTGINEVSAQWKVWVEWDDTECNCGPILAKSAYITIVYLDDPDPPIVYQEYFNLMNVSNPYQTWGSDTINMDCEDCYYVYARVIYEDSGGDCCHGYAFGTYDGDLLITSVFLPIINLE